MIKIFLSIIATTLLGSSTSQASSSTPKYLDSFPKDKAIYQKYTTLKKRADDLGINIENISIYRATRFIAESDYNMALGSGVIYPWDIYSPAPKTWVFWEKGNYFRKEFSKDLGKTLQATTSDFAELHKKIIDLELLGKGQQYLAMIPGFSSFFPLPGEYRSDGQVTSGFKAEVNESGKRAIEKYTTPRRRSLGLHSWECSDISASFSPSGDEKYIASVSYLDSKHVNSAMQEFVEDFNFGMEMFFYYPEGSTESPIEFAVRMQKKYVMIHPFHESNGRMSRMVQDLILDALGFPYVPAGYLQEDVTTPDDEYVLNTKNAMSMMNSKLDDCLTKFESGASFGVECIPLYSQKKISRGVPSYSGADQINMLSRIRTVICKDFLKTGNPFCSSDVGSELVKITKSVGSDSTTLYNPETTLKRAVMESLAVPLEEDTVFYTWLPNETIPKLRMRLSQNSLTYRKCILGDTCKISPKAKMGAGIYVAEEPWSSGQFAMSGSNYSKFAIEYPNVVSIPDAKSRLLKKSEKWTEDGTLHVVNVKKGQMYLDLTDPENVAILERLGMSVTDAGSLNPNVLVKYYNRTHRQKSIDGKMKTVRGRGKNWLVIKLQDSGAFSVREATVEDFSHDQKLEIRTQLRGNNVLGGQSFLKKVIFGL